MNCKHSMSDRRINGGDGREWCACCGEYMTLSKSEREVEKLLVQVADAQAKSLADERRIEELTNTIREYFAHHDWLDHADDCPVANAINLSITPECNCGYDALRAALRVGTPHE